MVAVGLIGLLLIYKLLYRDQGVQMNSDMNEISDTWQSIRNWGDLNAPHLMKSLNEKGDDQQIDDVASETGHAETQLWEFLKIMNGNTRYIDIFPVPGLKLLNIDEITSETQSWREIWEENQEDRALGVQDVYEIKSYPARFIKEEYILPEYIPFASDKMGNFLAIDFNPGPLGTVGQVINMGPDENNRYAIASSFVEFLNLILFLLESGKISVNQKDKDRNLFWSDPLMYQFLDSLPILYKEEYIPR
jgi:cell wall assembly regulator SMI1